MFIKLKSSFTGKKMEDNNFKNAACDFDYWKKKNSYYCSLIRDFFKSNIPVGSRVIEFGCATGDILSSCEPKRGLGIDYSSTFIESARKKHPQYEFRTADLEKFASDEKFDYCIMSDLLDHLKNIPAVIEGAYNVLSPDGKLVISTINPLWNPVFGLLEKMHMKMPEGPHCFIPNRFIESFCLMKGFKTISKSALVFIPVRIPLLSALLNKVMPALPLMYRFCWVQILVAQKIQGPERKLSCTIVIPAYNEEKNIEDCIRRIPRLDRNYQILVVDDGSKDATAKILEKLQKEIVNLKIVTFTQNQGKAHAVAAGINAAEKEVVIILDADMAVAPEDISLFVEPLEMGVADFVNGTRLVYAMEEKAMDQLRRIANFTLALMFSALIKCRITDTLCGTKSFFKKDFTGIDISEERWGDLVLLCTARSKGLRISEIPIGYHTRRAGLSKMRFFSDGMKFMSYTLKMALRELRGT